MVSLTPRDSQIGPLQLAIHVVQTAGWDTKIALGQDQQKAHIILNGNFLCLSCPSANFASQHGSFVPREWQAAKGLLRDLDRQVLFWPQKVVYF